VVDYSPVKLGTRFQDHCLMCFRPKPGYGISNISLNDPAGPCPGL
jgi:hypothetical protein